MGEVAGVCRLVVGLVEGQGMGVLCCESLRELGLDGSEVVGLLDVCDCDERDRKRVFNRGASYIPQPSPPHLFMELAARPMPAIPSPDLIHRQRIQAPCPSSF